MPREGEMVGMNGKQRRPGKTTTINEHWILAMDSVLRNTSGPIVTDSEQQKTSQTDRNDLIIDLTPHARSSRFPDAYFLQIPRSIDFVFFVVLWMVALLRSFRWKGFWFARLSIIMIVYLLCNRTDDKNQMIPRYATRTPQGFRWRCIKGLFDNYYLLVWRCWE